MTTSASEPPRPPEPSALSGTSGLWGHYAGFVSRFVAYVADLGVISGVYGLTLAAVSFAASLIVGHTINWDRNNLPAAIVYGCWWFVYFAYSWAATGKTFGMALLGIRVVSREGDVPGPRRAIIRALLFPVSFVLFGLGFVGILVDGERRALHDVVASTTVVYTWDARAQRLRFLARDELARVPAQPGPPATESTAETIAEAAAPPNAAGAEPGPMPGDSAPAQQR
jgi:uncharacterized RDD family membrane protein YckC